MSLLLNPAVHAICIRPVLGRVAAPRTITAVDRRGTVVFNKYVQPNAVSEQAAIAVHGIPTVMPVSVDQRVRS
ncbi:hypothetical protein [Actinomadura monticuli]|uniref:Uncharacterized protein n=1 Tax=Actinomadura monticuli TaxID=3097367 RepID=A0ABV4Q3V9_9ACTN